MDAFNIYMIGVGGQGIGLLSEVLLRAADHAGFAVKSVDTHGLAQRGGVVVSQLRFGKNVHSPLIGAGQADMVVAMERHEAMRGLNTALKTGGTLVYYDAVWQPLEVRLKKKAAISEADIEKQAEKLEARVIKVLKPDLKNARGQNIVLLARLDRERLIPGLETEHFKQAMDDLMAGSMLESNRLLYEAELAA